MKNLTENQQEIIDLITNEFVLINEKKATESDDIFAYIDSAVNEKKLYAEEMKQRNEAYRNVLNEKVDSFVDNISHIVNRYGYTCEIHETSETSGDVAQYFLVKILGEFGSIQWFYLYTNIETKDGIHSYANTDFTIYKRHQRDDLIKDCDIDKFVANVIINQLKSKIK